MPLPFLTLFLPAILFGVILAPLALLGAPLYYLYQILTGQMDVGVIAEFFNSLKDVLSEIFNGADWETIQELLNEIFPGLFGG